MGCIYQGDKNCIRWQFLHPVRFLRDLHTAKIGGACLNIGLKIGGVVSVQPSSTGIEEAAE